MECFHIPMMLFEVNTLRAADANITVRAAVVPRWKIPSRSDDTCFRSEGHAQEFTTRKYPRSIQDRGRRLIQHFRRKVVNGNHPQVLHRVQRGHRQAAPRV